MTRHSFQVTTHYWLLNLVFPKHFRMVTLPHTNTAILQESYYGCSITKPGLPVIASFSLSKQTFWPRTQYMFVTRCLKQNAPSCKFEQTWLALLHKNKPTLSSSAWPLFSNTFLTLKERHCMIKNKCPIQNISRQIKFCHWLNTLDYATNKILNAMK